MRLIVSLHPNAPPPPPQSSNSHTHAYTQTYICQRKRQSWSSRLEAFVWAHTHKRYTHTPEPTRAHKFQINLFTRKLRRRPVAPSCARDGWRLTFGGGGGTRKNHNNQTELLVARRVGATHDSLALDICAIEFADYGAFIRDRASAVQRIACTCESCVRVRVCVCMCQKFTCTMLACASSVSVHRRYNVY